MKIHKEGAVTILMALVFAVLLGGTSWYFGARAPKVLYWILFCIPAGFAVFFICFFREPRRRPAGDSRRITAPADGKVVIIQEVEEPEYFQDRRLQISVFMSFFDVHVNWAPVSGIISFYRYHRGSYLAAWHSKSSTKNERTTIVFKNEDGTEVLCRQIAGLFARRVAVQGRTADRLHQVRVQGRCFPAPRDQGQCIRRGQGSRGGDCHSRALCS